MAATPNPKSESPSAMLEGSHSRSPTPMMQRTSSSIMTTKRHDPYGANVIGPQEPGSASESPVPMVPRSPMVRRGSMPTGSFHTPNHFRPPSVGALGNGQQHVPPMLAVPQHGGISPVPGSSVGFDNDAIGPLVDDRSQTPHFGNSISQHPLAASFSRAYSPSVGQDATVPTDEPAGQPPTRPLPSPKPRGQLSLKTPKTQPRFVSAASRERRSSNATPANPEANRIIAASVPNAPHWAGVTSPTAVPPRSESALEHSHVAPHPSLNYSLVSLTEDQTEEDERRISQRKKQIEYGYSTQGYAEYRQRVPKWARQYDNEAHPVTPRVEYKCAKRTFDSILKAWRRALHQWDLEGGAEPLPNNGRKKQGTELWQLQLEPRPKEQEVPKHQVTPPPAAQQVHEASQQQPAAGPNTAIKVGLWNHNGGVPHGAEPVVARPKTIGGKPVPGTSVTSPLAAHPMAAMHQNTDPARHIDFDAMTQQEAVMELSQGQSPLYSAVSPGGFPPNKPPRAQSRNAAGPYQSHGHPAY